MAWIIAYIKVPRHVFNDDRNAHLRATEELPSFDDVTETDAEYSDHGTPASMPDPDEDLRLRLTTDNFPKDASAGFVFGSNEHLCDIVLPPLNSPNCHSISGRHFAITFHANDGDVFLRNLAGRGTRIIADLTRGRLKQQRLLTKEVITVRVGGFVLEIHREWDEGAVLPRCYWDFLAGLANGVPNLAVMRLTTATEPSASTITTSASSRKKIVYGAEVRIGSGNSGVVFRAKNMQDGSPVAVKRYTTGEAWWKENSRLCGLQNDHLATFHEFNCRLGQEPELIMEFAPLGNMVWQGAIAAFTSREGRTIVNQVLKALEYLHERFMVHRDIRPANILVMSRDPIHVKVADFSASAEAIHYNTLSSLDIYAAPDMFWPPFTTQVDIWSVGVMAMELCIGLPQRCPAWTQAILMQYQSQPASATRDFLEKCLWIEPTVRATAVQCLQHPFFSDLPNDGIRIPAGNLGRNGADSVPRLPNGQIPSHLQWGGERIEDIPRFLSHIGPQPEMSSFAPGNIHTVDPAHTANWHTEVASNQQFPVVATEHQLPGVASQHQLPEVASNRQSYADAIGPHAALSNDRPQQAAAERTVRGTTYNFFLWHGKDIAYIAERDMVNVTSLLAAAHTPRKNIRSRKFADWFKRNGTRLNVGSTGLTGIYMLYGNALEACRLQNIDTSGLPDFISQGLPSDSESTSPRTSEVLFDEPGFVRVVSVRNTGPMPQCDSVSMRLSDHRINAYEIIKAAKLPDAQRDGWRRRVKEYVDERNKAWIPFHDAVFLSYSLGVQDLLLPLLRQAGLPIHSQEQNYFDNPLKLGTIAPPGSKILWVGDGFRVPYKPNEGLINISALVRTADVSDAELSGFLNRSQFTREVYSDSAKVLRGTYVSYSTAEEVCRQFRIDLAPLRGLQGVIATAVAAIFIVFAAFAALQHVLSLLSLLPYNMYCRYCIFCLFCFYFPAFCFISLFFAIHGHNIFARSTNPLHKWPPRMGRASAQ